MMRHSRLALLATLVTGTAMAQGVAVSTTTIAQSWKQDTPGFAQGSFTPVTELVGIDVTKIGGQDALSLHLYAWGRTDLADQSSIEGKNAGNFSYGYLQYDFRQANASIKAGRVTVNQGLGPVAMDGVEARTDLRYGFTASGFAGTPVIYKNLSDNPQNEITFQKNVMFGGRFAWRAPKQGEIGISYLQEGSSAAQSLTIPEPVDYTRRQLGADIRLIPCSFVDITGRTVLNVADHQEPTSTESPNRIAEHDYKATIKATDSLSLAGTYTERNFYAFFAGTTLPSLFNRDEQGMVKATGASVTWAALANLQLVADVRRADRTAYGVTTRAGGDFRYSLPDAHILAGAGYHKVNAFSTLSVVTPFPSYSLSHSEMRAWLMADRGPLSASLDVIRLHYSSPYSNANLAGQGIESAIVGSLGYKPKESLKVSGDLTIEDNPLFRKQAMGLVRVEYRFGFASKGGK